MISNRFASLALAIIFVCISLPANPALAASAKMEELERRLEEQQRLMEQQRKDGGWRQNKELESDAYATGTALATLIELDCLSSRSSLSWD